MHKRIIYLFCLILFLNSCQGNWDSVKRGLTGAKQDTTDEFLVEKKDPLILPPNFETLPVPAENVGIAQETYDFEKVLKRKNKSLDENISDSARTTEESILRKIQNK